MTFTETQHTTTKEYYESLGLEIVRFDEYEGIGNLPVFKYTPKLYHLLSNPQAKTIPENDTTLLYEMDILWTKQGEYNQPNDKWEKPFVPFCPSAERRWQETAMYDKYPNHPLASNIAVWEMIDDNFIEFNIPNNVIQKGLDTLTGEPTTIVIWENASGNLEARLATPPILGTFIWGESSTPQLLFDTRVETARSNNMPNYGVILKRPIVKDKMGANNLVLLKNQAIRHTQSHLQP